VENSNLHDFDFTGILSSANSTVKIVGNTLTPDSNAEAAIGALNADSTTISGNVVNGPSAPAGCDPTYGYFCAGIIVTPAPAGSVTHNTVAGVGGGYSGILLLGQGDYPTTMSVTSNTVFYIPGGDGIQLNSFVAALPALTIKDNTIMQSGNGINFECNLNNNVSSNTITAIHSYGVANVPTGENSPNTYYNVPTLYSTCP
jgi:Right handed beta helix region